MLEQCLCKAHANEFLPVYYAQQREVIGSPHILDGAAEFVLDSTIYDAQPGDSVEPFGYVNLLENGGRRRFMFLIGAVEVWTLRGVFVDPPPAARALTHQALICVSNALGGELDSVVIDNLDQQARRYYAKLRIIQQGKVITCDVRPSDALIVATLADVPVFVAESVLAKI